MLYYLAFLFFFITDFYFLIPAVIAQIFIPTAELRISTGTQTNETNAEFETQPVIAEDKISNLQHNLNTYMFFYIFHSLNHYILFHLKDNFFFHQFVLI